MTRVTDRPQVHADISHLGQESRWIEMRLGKSRYAITETRITHVTQPQAYLSCESTPKKEKFCGNGESRTGTEKEHAALELEALIHSKATPTA